MSWKMHWFSEFTLLLQGDTGRHPSEPVGALNPAGFNLV